MKTTGICSQKQIDDLKRRNRSQSVQKELSLREMIVSCYVYNGAEKGSYNYQRYILPYQKEMADDVFESVYADQMAYLNTCSVASAVYSDFEGCTYNSLIEPA